MPRAALDQLNVRSAFARSRCRELAALTGMTVTEVVEEALRAYAPPPSAAVGRLKQAGPLLVLPAGGGESISLTQANAALEAVRVFDRDS